ncbi:MAG: hypothetical protein JXM73_04380 [Anaerolineae bacterium]|nr:hypothetical protein [Anaerolineae bacterium]
MKDALCPRETCPPTLLVGVSALALLLSSPDLIVSALPSSPLTVTLRQGESETRAPGPFRAVATPGAATLSRDARARRFGASTHDATFFWNGAAARRGLTISE